MGDGEAVLRNRGGGGNENRAEPPKDYTPRRIVSGFMGHTVGGVGTPWHLEGVYYIEVACFASGCNFIGWIGWNLWR